MQFIEYKNVVIKAENIRTLILAENTFDKLLSVHPWLDLQRAKNEPHDHEGVLWIYGDSVSKSFAEHLVTGPYRQICEDVFKHCKMTYSWVDNIDNVRKDENLDGEDYDHEKVMREITKV